MRLLPLGLACLALAAPGCEQQSAAAPTEHLPAWDGHDREVFDDNIDPAAVGLSMEGPSARADKFLRERAQTAEVVGFMRVDTVTIDTIGEMKRFHLGVKVANPTIAQSALEAREFELRVADGNDVFGAGVESRLRGRTFIGFIHRYAGDDGEAHVHWHLSANSPDVLAAVKEALALREVSRR